MGYKLEEYDNPAQNVQNDRVGYSFSSDDGNTAVWVINDHVDIGVTDNEIFEYFSNNKKNKLKSIHTSKKLLRFITSIRSDIEEETREHLVKIFLNMTDDPEGKRLFNDLLQITKFESLDSLYYSEIKQDFKKFLLY
jgi:ABC-type phosphate/phosphonate transport system substrate-binding protein